MQNPIMCVPCSVCEKFRIGKKGERQSPRPEGTKPNCVPCPKLKFGDDVGDERVMKAILLAGSGLPEHDMAIRKDSWMYSAVRLIRGYEQNKQTQAIDRQARDMSRSDKWQR